jgi:MFS family permease
MPLETPRGKLPFESLHALDWLNFFLAALLTRFGPFVALYLGDRGWGSSDIGLVLTVSGLSGLLTQVPAGELIDMTQSKRALVGAGIAALGLALLIFVLRPDLPSIFVAAVLQGVAGSLLGPGITAISLGLVGPDGLAERLGRNQRFASVGALTGAGIIGLASYVLSDRATLVVSVALAGPLLLALIRIHAADIHFCRSCGAPESDPKNPPRVKRTALLGDHRLLTFAACLFLFQLANASILPLLGERLVHAEARWSSPILSALIVVPQIVVAVLAPWVGRTAESWGRRPLLLIGLGVVPIRCGLLALTSDPTLLIAIQVLDGLSGATLGVLTALVIADITSGTGRFNLAQGVVGTLSGVGASLSTSISGLIVGRYGDVTGFLSVSAIGLIAVAILLLFLPETKAPVLPLAFSSRPTELRHDRRAADQ